MNNHCKIVIKYLFTSISSNNITIRFLFGLCNDLLRFFSFFERLTKRSESKHLMQSGILQMTICFVFLLSNLNQLYIHLIYLYLFFYFSF
ncbi:unnamed protein product [Rotaria socialis]